MTSMRIAAWLCGILLTMVSAAVAAPCSPVSDCSDWLALGSRGTRVLVHRSFPLDQENPDVSRALVVIHGAGRDADNYFRHVLAAAFLAGALDDTVVISPRFASNSGEGCHDAVAEHEATWHCHGPARWTAGGGAVNDDTVTSFDAVDEILKKLAR